MSTARKTQTSNTWSSAASGGEGVTRQIAEAMAGLTFETLPARLVELVKQCVLDTLGVIIGASSLAPEAAMVEGYIRDLGGKPESTILGFGGKAPAPWAVFVNGSLGHMLDYDDVGGGHVSVTTVPVAFAVAEKLGGMTGRDLITAIAAGIDLQTRLANAIQIPDWTIAEGWFATQLFGYMSGAITAGRLLKLDAGGMENALGIGFNQMAGSRQMAVGAATHMRSMQAGFSGQGAIMAADLAARGIIGDREPLEGRYGLFKTYVRDGAPDWQAVVGGLGQSFPILESHGFKVWPACGYTRAPNAAVLELRREHKLCPEDVETITIIGGSGGTRLLCEPLDLKRRPKTSIDGKYSIPFTTAVMMAKGNVTLSDYTDEGLRDPAVLAMADRVFYRDDGLPVTHRDGTRVLPGIEIRTKDGRTLSRKVESLPGDAQNPVDRSQLEVKFRDCVSFSKTPISPDRVERAIRAVWDLESLDDATEVIRLLS